MGFFSDVVPFLRSCFAVWGICTSFVVDMVFKIFNSYVVRVAVREVNFPSFKCFA